MAVTIACLCEAFTTVNTFERQLIVVRSKMISQVTHLGEGQRTVVAFQHLIESTSFGVFAVVNMVVFVLQWLLIRVILLCLEKVLQNCLMLLQILISDELNHLLDFFKHFIFGET